MQLYQTQPLLFPYTTLFRSKRIYHQLHSRNRVEVPSAVYDYDQTDRQVRKSVATASGEALNMAEPKLLNREIVFKGSHVQRSEEHTSELQSHHDLVCRLLLE